MVSHRCSKQFRPKFRGTVWILTNSVKLGRPPTNFICPENLRSRTHHLCPCWNSQHLGLGYPKLNGRDQDFSWENTHRVTLCFLKNFDVHWHLTLVPKTPFFLVSNPLGRKLWITRCDQQCGISRASDEQALLSGQVLFSSHKYGTFSSATLRFLRYWVSTLKPVIHSNPSGLSYSNVDSCIYTESGSAIFSIMWLVTVRSLPE